MPVKRIGIVGNPQRPEVTKAIDRFSGLARKGGMEVWVDGDLAGLCRDGDGFCRREAMSDRVDVVVAFVPEGDIDNGRYVVKQF